MSQVSEFSLCEEVSAGPNIRSHRAPTRAPDVLLLAPRVPDSRRAGCGHISQECRSGQQPPSTEIDVTVCSAARSLKAARASSGKTSALRARDCVREEGSSLAAVDRGE